MKQRISDLRETIYASGTKGTNLVALINRFAVEHGLRTSKVAEYIKMLQHGGYIHENNGRVYRVPDV